MAIIILSWLLIGQGIIHYRLFSSSQSDRDKLYNNKLLPAWAKSALTLLGGIAWPYTLIRLILKKKK